MAFPPIPTALPGPAAAAAAFDLEAVMVLLDGSTDLFRLVVDEMSRSVPRLLEAARSALDAGDAKGVREAAHTIKGSLGCVAAAAAAERARAVEMAAREGRLDQARRELEALDPAARALLVELAAAVSRLAA